MNNTSCGLLIVGAGHAGVQLAFELRKHDRQRRIVLLSEEPHPPYHRPPLSKQFLANGEDAPVATPLRASTDYQQQGIELWLDTRVARIDRAARRVLLSDGRHLPYEQLVLATGGRARALPQLDEQGSLSLRGLSDALRLRECLRPGARIGIVGAGYIGLEVAATAIAAGASVHVFERNARILERVTTETVASFLHDQHHARGVRFHLDTEVLGAKGPEGGAARTLHFRERGVERALEFDALLVCIGIVPNVELAKEAGLALDNGIEVDEGFRTSDEHIFAIGDCARQVHPILARPLRIESLPNAIDQSRALAAVLAKKSVSREAVPWFWSDQYDLKLQMVGLSAGHDLCVVRGQPQARSFSVFYLREGRVVAVDAINRSRDFLLGKRLVQQGAHPDPKALADTDREIEA